MDEIGTIYDCYWHAKNNKQSRLKDDEILYFFLRHFSLNRHTCLKFYNQDYYNKLKKYAKRNYIYSWTKRACNMGVIEFDKNGFHGAEYYKITNYGLYYIFKNYLHRENKQVLIEDAHQHQYLIKTLFTFFEKDTVNKIEDRMIIKEMFFYIQRVCLSIAKLMPELKVIDENKSYTSITSFNDSIVTYEPHRKDDYLVEEMRLFGNDNPDNHHLLDDLEKLSLEELERVEPSNTETVNPVFEYIKKILGSKKHWYHYELVQHCSLLCRGILEYVCSDPALADLDAREKVRSTKKLKSDNKFLELINSTKSELFLASTRFESHRDNFLSK